MAHTLTAEDKKFQTEDDLRTIRRAKEIQDDPARLKATTELAEEEIKALNAIQGSTLLTGKKKKTLIT